MLRRRSPNQRHVRQGRRLADQTARRLGLEQLEPRIVLTSSVPLWTELLQGNDGSAASRPADLLLINDQLPAAAEIAAAAHPATLVVSYDGQHALTPDLVDLVARSMESAGMDRAASLSLFTHGNDGRLEISVDETWSSDHLGDAGEDLHALGQLLAEDAPILLYGCSLAASAEGRLFVDQLHGQTGRTILASDDPVGNIGQADWHWEYQAGLAAAAPTALDLSALPDMMLLGDGYERNWGHGNDSIDDAFYLGAAGGFQIDGLEIHNRSDVDWYSFWLDQPGTSSDFVQIEFTHSEGDLDLELFDEQHLLVDSAESTTDNERIELAGLDGGRNYYLYVSGHAGATNGYSMTVSAQPHQFSGDWKETSDNTTLLPEIHPGLGLTQLTIDSASDTDFFWFPLQGSATTADYIKAHGFQTDNLDLELILYDADSEFLREATSTAANEYLSLDGLPYGWYQLGVYAADNSFVAGSEYSLDLFGPAADAVDRYEPNGTFAEAVVLGGATDIWDISITADDFDTFEFELPSSGTSAEFIEIQFDHSTGDLELQLYDTDNNLLDGSYSVGDAERIDFRDLAAGTYRAAVFGHSETDTGEYYLRLVYPPLLAADSHEQDDRWQDASELGVIDGRVDVSSLSIDAAHDDDWFTFSLSDWGELGDTIQLSFEHDRGDLAMALYEKDGDDFILVDEADGQGDLEEIDLSDLAPITYYLQVYGLGATNPDYRLTLLQPRTLTADRFEPNEDLQQAWELGAVGKPLELTGLTIHDESDVDLFRFETVDVGEPSSAIRLQFNGHRSDLDLHLLDSDGNLLRSSTEADGSQESISLNGLPEDVYYVQIEGYEGDTAADYTLVFDPPTLFVWGEDIYEEDEGNNTTSTATRLTNTESQQLAGEMEIADLTIHDADDVDVFAFTTIATGTAANSVTIEFEDDQGVLALELLNASGQSIVQGTRSRGRSRASLDGLEAGQYYAAVRSSGSATNEYLLEVGSPRSSDPAQNVGDWTVMVYITADDLQLSAFNDINEMEIAAQKLGSDVSIAVLWDQSSQGTRQYPTPGEPAWGDVGLGIIQPDDDPKLIQTEFERIGERNTGDPETLTQFISWATSQRPADHYALFMWDHGDGLKGFNFDESDDHDDDNLTTSELASALAGELPELDLLAFDECLMAVLEVAYELEDGTDVFVASQELEDGGGYDYSQLFTILEQSAEDVTAEQFASHIVATYQQTYQHADGYEDTTSAILTDQLPGLAAALKQFTALALGDGTTDADWAGIAGARNSSANYEESYLRDLGHFMEGVIRNTDIGQSIRSAALAVREALGRAVLDKTNDRRGSSGLSIYLPQDSTVAAGETTVEGYSDEYDSFVTATDWDSFTDELRGKLGPTSEIRNDWSEANNSIHAAHDLGRVVGVGNVFPSLNLTSQSDTDWFSFQMSSEAQAAHRLMATPTNKDLELKISLYGQDKSLLASSEGAGDRQIGLEQLPAGRYYVEVSSSSPRVPGYVITIDAPGTPTSDRLTNDSLEKSLQLGMIAGSRFLYKNPVESNTTSWFKFDAPVALNPSPSNLLVRSQHAITAELLDSSGTTIAQGEGTFVHLGYTPSGQGDSYTLKLTGRDNDTSADLLFAPAPTARADAYVAVEDTELVVGVGQSVLSNDGSTNNDTFVPVLHSAPAHGTLQLATDGTFRYTPDANFFGADSFTYRIDDSSAISPPATVTLNVSPVNDTPGFAALSDMTIDEDAGPQTVTVSAIHPGPLESQPLRLLAASDNPSLIPQPSVSYVSPGSSGTLTFASVPDASGSATITVTLEDGGLDADLSTSGDNASHTETFTVTVNAVNDPPLMDVPASLTVPEDADQQSVDLTGIAAGGGEIQPLRVTSSSSNTQIIPAVQLQYTSASSTGTLSFTPASDAFGSLTIQIMIEDGGLDGDLGTAADNATTQVALPVTVSAVNDQPTIDSIDDLAILEDSDRVTITLSGISPGPLEAESILITATSDNPSLIPDPSVEHTAGESTATLSFAPLADANGLATIRVLVVDAGLDGDLATSEDNLSRDQTFEVTVTAVPDVPRAVDDQYEVPENNPLEVSANAGVLANDRDPEGDPMTAQLVQSTRYGVLDFRSDGSFDYTPEAGFNRTDTFQYRAVDATGPSSTATVSLVVQTSTPWHNSLAPMDVNDDGQVGVVDALLIINDINQNGARELPVNRGEGTIPPLLDVNRDNHVSPMDILIIINFLNEQASGEGDGEGEPSFDLVLNSTHFTAARPARHTEAADIHQQVPAGKPRTAGNWQRQVDLALTQWWLPNTPLRDDNPADATLVDDGLLDTLCE